MPPSVALSTLEQQKAGILADVAAWPPERLTFRPAPAAWSAVQVIDHLVRVEREILAAARRGLSDPHRRGILDRVRVELLDRLFRSDRRVPVPRSVPEVLPSPDVTLRTVQHEWDLTRRDLAGFLAPLTPNELADGVFRHPVAGWMNVREVLRFFWVHSHHHGFQLARIRDAAGTQQ